MPFCPRCGNKDVSSETSPEYPHFDFSDVMCVRIVMLCRDKKKCGYSWDMVGTKQINMPEKKQAI